MPTDCLEKVSSLLKGEPYIQKYEACEHERPQVHSLLHTFPRFKLKDVNLWFDLIPSEDCHLVCEALNFERSTTGLPYPKLEIFAQSLLDTYNAVALADLIDGMDLSEEWVPNISTSVGTMMLSGRYKRTDASENRYQRRRLRFCSKLTKARGARKKSGMTLCEQKIDASILHCRRSYMRPDFALEEVEILDCSRETLFETRPSYKASRIHCGILNVPGQRGTSHIRISLCTY